MGFLRNQSASTSGVLGDWQHLRSEDDLNAAEEQSKTKPVVLFKHSTTCGTSAYALSRLRELEQSDAYTFYYLDLLAYRSVSNEISARYGVIHQSPQIIILKDGKATFDTSHHAISAQVVAQNIR